jgi:hypothetical protein
VAISNPMSSRSLTGQDGWSATSLANAPNRGAVHVLPEPTLGLHDTPVPVLMANPGSSADARGGR